MFFCRSNISIWSGSQALKPSRQAVANLTKGQNVALLIQIYMAELAYRPGRHGRGDTGKYGCD